MIQRMSEAVASYIVKQGTIDEKDHDLYSYGLLVIVEKGLVILSSIAIAVILGTYVECGIFFLVFIPLRAYAGGLHLEKFWSCFLMSCAVLVSIMLLPKIIIVPVAISLPMTFLLLLYVYSMYPVENANRVIDEAEKRYFKSKLQQFLVIDFALSILVAVLGNDNYLEIIMLTLLCVAATMKIGKIHYNSLFFLNLPCCTKKKTKIFPFECPEYRFLPPIGGASHSGIVYNYIATNGSQTGDDNMLWILRDVPLGRNIQFLRISRNMTQNDVAAKLQLVGSNMSRSTLANIESGKRNIKASDLKALKELFKCEFDDFFAD
jgi:accessory gene regulator B